MSWFKWCFYCKGKDSLLKTSISLYAGYRDYHYHLTCLKKVLKFPIENKKFIDMALEIATCIDDEKRQEEIKENRAKELLKRI